jgi:predicted nucleic acid-binding protein
LKIIVDTNVTISGLLWGGAPIQILKFCRNGIFHILECEETFDEVKSVLRYSKSSDRLSAPSLFQGIGIYLSLRAIGAFR